MSFPFLDGLRYILIHQYIDRENDRATGIHTFVSDSRVNIRKGILCLCILEAVCCILLLIPLLPEYAAVVIAGLLFNLLLEFCIWQVLNVYAGKDWLVSYDSVPAGGVPEYHYAGHVRDLHDEEKRMGGDLQRVYPDLLFQIAEDKAGDCRRICEVQDFINR